MKKSQKTKRKKILSYKKIYYFHFKLKRKKP